MDDWQSLREQDWESIRDYARELLEQRQQAARHDYGSGLRGEYLRGDPVTYMENVLGDALAYLYFLRRQRELPANPWNPGNYV